MPREPTTTSRQHIMKSCSDQAAALIELEKAAGIWDIDF